MAVLETKGTKAARAPKHKALTILHSENRVISTEDSAKYATDCHFDRRRRFCRRGGETRFSTTIMTALAAVAVIFGATHAHAQDSSTQQTTSVTLPSKIAVAAPVTYNNKWEIYGGLNFMNFQAGQAIPKRMNLGGGEILGTYWLHSGPDWVNKKLGLALNYRGEAGTTPVFAGAGVDPYDISRPLVYMNMLMGGVQYRGPKNQFIAINYHGYFGAAKGVFNATQKANQPLFYQLTGLYTNRTKPIGAVGGSIDFNLSNRAAIRLSPDLIIEHFGTETREFFGISAGYVYRFGKR